MKLNKVLCCVFLFSFFSLDGAQKNNCLLRTEELVIETCGLRNSYIVYERKIKDCAGSWTLQHKSWHLCLFL